MCCVSHAKLHFGEELQLGQVPIEAFAQRAPDPSGRRGRPIKVLLHARNSKRIDDPRDAEIWARTIEAAKAGSFL